MFVNPIWRRYLFNPVLIPRRGAKQKWGNISRDPYKTFQKKLDRKTAHGKTKIPLKSEERALREMVYPLNVKSLGQVITEYVPLEKFSRSPLYTRKGLNQRWQGIKESLQTIYGGALIRRKMRKIDPFKPSVFARWGQEQFIAANTAIQSNDKETLRTVATENASESLKSEFRSKVFKWKFVEQIERPRVVTARVAPLSTKDDLYGQLVIRLHSAQILSVHDMAGRLLRGNPSKPKNVIDYVVFERPLSSLDARWRICGKLPPQLPINATNS